MLTLTIGEAKTRFAEILNRANAGETIIITEGQKRKIKAKLVPPEMNKKARKLGFLVGKGSAIIHDDFKITLNEFLGNE